MENNSKYKTWQKIRMGDAVRIRRGASPRPIHDYMAFSGMPWLKIADVTGMSSRFIESTKEFIKEEGVRNTVIVHPGDLIVSNSATPGIPKFMAMTAGIHDGWLLLDPDLVKIDKLFLYYKLLVDRKKLVSNATGAVFDNLKTDILRDHELSLPSLKEQTCIAEFLGAFDDKIEVNNKIIKNLEELAQTIFKEWFVKFRFPGHEKTKFVDSELGQIPEGWEVQIIRDIATIKKGISYSSSEISDTGEGLPFINLANFKRGGGIKPDGIKFYTGNYKPSDLVRPGDIVLAMTDLTSNREVIGHPARVPSYAKWDEILISLDVCAIEIEPIYIEFLYYLMLRRDFAFLMASSAGGTNVSHLSKTSIERYSFVKPTESVLGKFQEIVKPIFNKINIAEAENESLVNLRDLFLPKVIKGEVEV